MKRNWQAAAGALLVMVIALVASRVVDGDTQNSVTTDNQSQPTVSITVAGAGLDDGAGPDAAEEPVRVERFSNLPTIDQASLPDEAVDVLALITAGGPYPYPQDDGVFQNREGILPQAATGHYREYTVDTPGSADRGARRIVVGADGGNYYTDDHYDSFEEIVTE